MKKILFILSLMLITSLIFSQEISINKYGKILRYQLDNTAFPHKYRKGGYVYKGKHYTVKEHYSDNSTIVFIPNHIKLTDSVHLVFYFHGWWNNIDSSFTNYHICEQFSKSKINALLIMTETAKNAPDSFGGKLEEKDGFNNLLEEINKELNDYFDEDIYIKQISLAGHSGAYRVIAFMLMNGGITEKIKNIFLFDALYSDVEKFTYWLDNYSGKFINIFTPNGGTKDESENLIMCLNSWGIPNIVLEDDFMIEELAENRIINIASKLNHRDVVYKYNQFEKFLKSIIGPTIAE